MAEFRGKQGHWVTTESGSHVFIESGKSFDEAISDAFGKENKGKYKKLEKLEKLNGDTVYQTEDEETGDVLTFKSKEEAEKYLNGDDFDNDNDFENWDDDEFVENIDNIDYSKAEKNEKKNADKGRKPDGSLSDEAFKIGQKGAKAYLDFMTQYNDLDKLKSSNIFLGGLQNAVSKAITEAGYNPNLELTYNDFNDVIGSVLGEEVDIAEYENNATKGFTGKKYNTVKTIHESLKDSVLNGEITLDEAASELNKAGWYNFKPSKKETLKALGLEKEPDVKLKKRISKEEADSLLKKDFKNLSDEEKENLINYFKIMR